MVQSKQKYIGQHMMGSGFTLLELIFSMVIVSIAMVTLFFVMGESVKRSIDPMIRQQSIDIAQLYMENIISRSVADHAGAATQGGACLGEFGALDRASYTNICQFRGVEDNPPQNANGDDLVQFSQYTVTVNVTREATAGQNDLFFGPSTDAPGATDGVATLAIDNSDANNSDNIYLLRIDVTVRHETGFELSISTFRINYAY